MLPQDNARRQTASVLLLAIPDEYFDCRMGAGKVLLRQEARLARGVAGPVRVRYPQIYQDCLTFNRFSRMLRKIRSYVSWSPATGRFTSIRTVRPKSRVEPFPICAWLVAVVDFSDLGFTAFGFAVEGFAADGAVAVPWPAKPARS